MKYLTLLIIFQLNFAFDIIAQCKYDREKVATPDYSYERVTPLNQIKRLAGYPPVVEYWSTIDNDTTIYCTISIATSSTYDKYTDVQIAYQFEDGTFLKIEGQNVKFYDVNCGSGTCYSTYQSTVNLTKAQLTEIANKNLVKVWFGNVLSSSDFSKGWTTKSKAGANCILELY
jgi:hypothetical protein